MPGPEVAVIARAPAQPAPSTMPMAASSSSACTTAKVALPSGVTRSFFSRSVVASTTEVEGVIGYHATTVTPAKTAPMPQAALPSMMILPAVCIHPLDEERVLLGQIRLGIVEARLDGAEVQIEDLLLLGELAQQAALHHAQIDGQHLGDDAHVDHVLDQLAQLGLGTDGGRDLVEGNGIEDEIVARLIELQVLLVDDHAAGGQGQHVRLRCLRIQRHQNLGVVLAGDVAFRAGADDVPGGLSGDVRGEKVFPADRNAHAEDALQQHAIGGLRAGAVYCSYVDAEVV